MGDNIQPINFQEPTAPTSVSSIPQSNVPNAPQPAGGGNGLDQSVIALMHGIKQQESGGNYQQLGDKNAAGQYTAAGVGQWSNQPNGKPEPLQPGQIPYNFQADAKQFGLDPTDFSPANQNHVMYEVIANYKKQGLSPEQIASKWNSGGANNYLTDTTNQSGSVGTYNVSNYVKNVMSYAQKYAQKNNGEGTTNGLPNAPQAPVQESVPSTATAQGNGSNTSQPEGLGQKALDVVKGVGNFLFPIVGDVYGDVTGTNKKTVLQQVGDAALSALPFIPGLGEVGDAARAGDVAAEAGGGLLSKLTGSTIAKGAGIGYGAGVASNLSQGQGIGQAFTPNINNLGGAVLGGAAPVALKGLSAAVRGMAGIDPAVANELAKMGTQANPEDVPLMKMYNGAAAAHATDINTPSVINVAADNLDKAAANVTEQRQAAGALQNQVKQAVFNKPLQDASSVASNFSNEIKQRYGLNVGSDPNGQIILEQNSARRIQNDPADLSIIQSLAQQLNGLGKGSVVGNATDVITNIDNTLNKLPTNAFGKTISPIDQLLVSTRNQLNDIVRSSAPDLANANDTFSGLKNLESEIGKMAGGGLQRGELLMQRVLTNKSADSLNLFAKIKAATGIDLTKHAVLAENAIKNYGSNADKSLLGQMLNEASKGTGGIAGMIFKGAKYAAQKTIANPSKVSMNLLRGKSGILSRLSPYITKGAIEAGSRGLGGIVSGQ